MKPSHEGLHGFEGGLDNSHKLPLVNFVILLQKPAPIGAGRVRFEVVVDALEPAARKLQEFARHPEVSGLLEVPLPVRSELCSAFGDPHCCSRALQRRTS